MFGVIAGLIAIFIQLPIWFYIVYYILEKVNASELVWFLFWLYAPASFFVHTVAYLVKKSTKK